MGSSLHTSVTLFVRIKDGLKEQVRPTNMETCSNENCKKHKETFWGQAFCHFCGSKVQRMEVMIPQKVNINNIAVLEALGDPFFQPEGVQYIHKTDLFLPYNPLVGDRRNRPFDEECGVITLEDMHKLKQGYMDHYENHKTASLFFKALQQEFGEENVTLEFGVISYYW